EIFQANGSVTVRRQKSAEFLEVLTPVDIRFEQIFGTALHATAQNIEKGEVVGVGQAGFNNQQTGNHRCGGESRTFGKDPKQARAYSNIQKRVDRQQMANADVDVTR